MPNVKVSTGVGWLLANCEECGEQAELVKLVPDGPMKILRFGCGCEETTDFKIRAIGFEEE